MSLLGDLKTKLNLVSESPVSVIKHSVNDLPDRQAEGVTSMEQSSGEGEILSALECAISDNNRDALAVESVKSIVCGIEESKENGRNEIVEHQLFYDSVDIELPFYFESYNQMSQAIIGNILRSEGLKSVNASFFGDVLKNAETTGFSRVTLGPHVFFVQDNSDRFVYIVEFLAAAKESLMSTRRFECPLTKSVNINGVTAYTLVLTPKELYHVSRSYPSYRLSYVTEGDISNIKLVIKT